MEETPRIITNQLKDTCKITDARWAAWIERVGPKWFVRYQFGFNPKKMQELNLLLENSNISTRILGGLKTGRTRSLKATHWETNLGCQTLFIFPNKNSQFVLLVGADKLERKSQVFFRVLAQTELSQSRTEISIEQALADTLMDLDVDASYDLHSVLERVLHMLIHYIPCDSSCIGLRYGDIVRLDAVWPQDKHLLGRQVPVDMGVLDDLILERSVKIVDDIKMGQPLPLLPEFHKHGGSWLGIPLLVGKRVIGIVCFFSEKINNFSQTNARQAVVVSAHMAPAIETSVALAEASHHLEKLAMLNELASAASVGMDADEVAAGIVLRLKRIFKTELVSILMLSSDGNTLHEFGESHPSSSPIVIPVASSLAGYVAETGIPVRVSDVKEAPRYLELTPGVRSELSVPLKYRGNVIGVLDLESQEPGAFSLRDEQLLVVMASQLAGMIENVRLNDETRERARNLDLIHHVVQNVVGLTEIPKIAQVAAEIMAGQFAFELALVNLVSEDGEFLVIEGMGGNISPKIVRGLRQPIEIGISGKVCKDGNSRLVNDVSLEPDYASLPDWKGGSEMCVALRDGPFVFGVVAVKRSQKDGFTPNDLLALEALAGVLSSVMINARNYQVLQVNLRRLQAVRETALDISADLELDTLLERVTLRARELVGAKGAELGLVNEENETVEIKVSEIPWKGYSKGLVLSYNQGVAGHIAVEGKTIVVDDYASWAGRLQLESTAPFTAVAGVPLKYKGKVIGTLTISHDEPERGFDPEDIRLLELLAPQMAVSVRNARLYQEVQTIMEAERLAKDRLVRSARLAAVGELAAGVAHELNNPLTTVAGFVELVLDDLPDDSPHRPDLELVLKESRRAREVVRRLLDFSRPGEGFRVKADINDLVRDVVALIKHLTHTSGVNLKIDLKEDLPWIQVDRDQIKQVLLNLIHNAIQAMPRGGVLTLLTNLKEREGMKGVMIQVQDTGQGISPENIERLFEPFFTTRSPGKGTGLGLSVSYGIITDHNGVIDVASKPEKGSTFTLWLPEQNIRPLF